MWIYDNDCVFCRRIDKVWNTPVQELELPLVANSRYLLSVGAHYESGFAKLVYRLHAEHCVDPSVRGIAEQWRGRLKYVANTLNTLQKCFNFFRTKYEYDGPPVWRHMLYKDDDLIKTEVMVMVVGICHWTTLQRMALHAMLCQEVDLPWFPHFKYRGLIFRIVVCCIICIMTWMR